MTQILQIVRLIWPYRRFIAQSLLVGIMFTFLSLPGPYITKFLIDDVYPQKDLELLDFVLIASTFFSIFLGFTKSLSAYFGRYVDLNMNFGLQLAFYHHIQSLDFSFFDKRETGEILARFGDMETAIGSVIGMINSIIMDVLKLLIFPIVLFYINWKLALISLSVLPLDTILASVTRKYYRMWSQKIAETSAEMSAKSFESLTSIRTVQSLGLEMNFYTKLRDLFAKEQSLKLRKSLFSNVCSFLSLFCQTLGALAYGWYGWTQVLSGNLSLGSYMAFSGYIGYLYGPLRNLVELIPNLEVTLVRTSRFLEIYNMKPIICDIPELPCLGNVKGQIEFHNVSFGYDSSVPVLQKINLLVPVRSTIALVGKSGSGKSTLVKLIPRFYDPDEGCVKIDGKDIKGFRIKSLRSKIGFAMQGSTMFQGTILDNLTFGQDIPLSDVEQAAQAAYIHDFIASLPQGYYNEIGEKGVGLSEGQKQRLALARVLLLDTPILLLDEPTAALDTESEFHIQQALTKIREGRTTIIIAHRLSTIQKADEIVVIEEGQIIEKGSHEILAHQDGMYSKLVGFAASI